MFYSKQTGGFYDVRIHNNSSGIPLDAVEITEAEWLALLDGQNNGQVISSDENGYPVLVNLPEPEPLTPEQLAAQPVTITQGQLDALLARLEAVERKRTK